MLDNSQLIFAATESKIYAKEFDPILESTRSDIPPLFVYLQRLHNLSAMMWMPLFLILLPLAADGWHFRRHRKTYRYRNLLLTLVAAGDLLPLAGIVLFWLVKDNTGGVVTAAMWIFFAYLLLTLPRMAYYIVRAFGKGRATRILAPIAALGMAGVLIHGAVSGRIDLSDTKYDVIYRKLFKIQETDLFRRLALPMTASGVEHLFRKLFHIDSGDLCQTSGCHL